MPSNHLRFDSSLDGRVFRWETERIPSHGVNDPSALHAVKVRQRVGNGIDAHVAHVEAAGRVWKHAQHEVGLLTPISNTSEVKYNIAEAV